MSVISMGVIGSAAAQTRGACSTELPRAEQRYQNGAFDEAMHLISECLDRAGVPPEQAVRAYRMLTLTHLKRDELTAARSAIINLLSTDPNYTPDPVEEPPVYVAMVSLVRRELHLGPSAVPIRAAQPLPFSSAVVALEIDRPTSWRSPRARAQASERNGERRQKMGW